MYRRFKLRVARVLGTFGMLDGFLRTWRVLRGAGESVRRGWARLRFRRSRRGGVRVYHERHWCDATVDEHMRSLDVMRANLRTAIELVESIGADYAMVPIASSYRYRIVVPSSSRRAVIEVISAPSDPNLHLWIETATIPWEGLPAVRGPSRRMLDAAPDIRVYRSYTDPKAALVFGSIHGCEIEFWSERDGVLSGEGGNLVTSAATTDEFGSARIDVGNLSVRTLPMVADRTHVYFDRFPVDLVYTWVDGSDPDWRRRRDHALGGVDTDGLAVDSAAEERFISRDELRYSLRSVSQFADFVHKVYLVTDRQVPSWLDTTNPRIVVVDHRDIFGDQTVLPTFNSHAIESQLHHIEGLSEHYVYMNDDFLFGRRVGADTFFHGNGVAKFFFSTAVLAAEDLSVDHAARISSDLLFGRFGVRVTAKMKHAPYPQRRSVNEDMERAFETELRATASHRLRSPDDVPTASSMSHYFGFLTGRAVPASIANAYVDLGGTEYRDRLAIVAESRRFDVICVNDTVTGLADAAERDRHLAEWLEAYYPVPGEFER